jgi:hypothetical protein
MLKIKYGARSKGEDKPGPACWECDQVPSKGNRMTNGVADHEIGNGGSEQCQRAEARRLQHDEMPPRLETERASVRGCWSDGGWVMLDV